MPGGNPYNKRLGRKPQKGEPDRNGRMPGHPAYEKGTSKGLNPKAPKPRSLSKPPTSQGMGYALGQAFGRLFESRLGGMQKQQKKPAQEATRSLNDLISAIVGAMPELPSGPSAISPQLVDIAATLKPFGEARQGVTQRVASGKAELAKSLQAGLADNKMVSAATQARLHDMAVMQKAAKEADRLMASSSAQGGVVDLAAQGVDASVVAAAKDAQRAGANQAAGASDAALSMLSDEQRQAAIEAVRNNSDVSTGNRLAVDALGASAFGAMNQISKDEVGARTQAEAFNAQARQQAAEQALALQQQQYEGKMQRFQDLAQIPGLVGQGAAPFLRFPKRDAVMQNIMNTTDTTNGLGRVLLDSLDPAGTPQDAMDSVINGIAALKKAREDSGGKSPNYNISQLRKLVSDFYAQDGSIGASDYERLRQQMTQGLG